MVINREPPFLVRYSGNEVGKTLKISVFKQQINSIKWHNLTCTLSLTDTLL